MHLLKDDIYQYGTLAAGAWCDIMGITPDRIMDHDYVKARLPEDEWGTYGDVVDFYVTSYVARQAETFVFDSEQIMEFLRSVDRKLPPGDYAYPFNFMVVQFTKPIPENLFLSGKYSDEHYVGTLGDEDAVAGLVMAFPPEDADGDVCSITAYYASTSINRATLSFNSDGTIAHAPMHAKGFTPEHAKDKQRIANLGMLCLAYINSPVVTVEKQSAPAKVNAKRKRKGKRPLPDYYLCYVRKEKTAGGSSSGGPGSQHSFAYPVRGHFRRLSSGQTVWVKSHIRGVAHAEEGVKPKVYRVK